VSRATQRPPPPAGNAFQSWGEQLNDYLTRTRSQLEVASPDATATDNGTILWDPSGYPVVSLNGSYRQVVLADGYAQIARTTSQTAAAADTPYPIVFDAIGAEGVSLGSPASRVVFAEAGVYLLAFTAQLYSTSASDTTHWFWPRINGVDLSGSTIRQTTHQNGSASVVARSALFTVEPGDYLEAVWAVSRTSGSLHAFPAETFAPATPAATLAVTRIRR
jgi:hypothetical protein